MATIITRQGLQFILSNVMADARAKGVSSIADFSTVVHFPTVSISAYSGRLLHSTTSTIRLTFHFATGTVDQQSQTVYDLLKDRESSPFKRYAETSRIFGQNFAAGSSPRFVHCSVIEDDTASPSNLVAALASFFVKQAERVIKDRQKPL